MAAGGRGAKDPGTPGKDLSLALQAIPSVDAILESRSFRALAAEWRREGLRRYLQLRLDAYREEVRGGAKGLAREEFLGRLAPRWAAEWKALAGSPTLRVVNATGVLLHTNLGRAVLAEPARKAVAVAARWPVDLELDLDRGERASRTRKVELLLRALTGAPAAFAVNNNAAALTLAVDTLARKRRLIVSRGEQVEIGGSFRLPEILERFAGRMVEVGTTNRTRIADYAKAIARKGDVLLKVHRSNFQQSGYVEEAGLAELVALGREKGCPVIYDLGSGRFEAGMEWLAEPPLEDALAAGPDLICFSGDKVFGGPQAGIILGAEATVAAMRRNPMARALRLDKLNLAALGETIALRLREEAELPTRRVLSRQRKEIRALAERLRAELSAPPVPGLALKLVDSEARSGGGAAAESAWPSSALVLTLKNVKPVRLAAALRGARPAVLGRLQQDEFQLDLAAVDPEEIPVLARILRRVCAREASR